MNRKEHRMSRVKHSEHESLGEHLKEAAAEVAHDVRERASDVAHNVRERASEYIEAGREKARDWEEGIEGFVQEKPLQSLLIAAGVGLLVGLLWRRH
jgi:ElaB/YqjD/DUF883 family membrane-anchored ribosome-binding protein